AVMARALDQWWDELGRPDPFVVMEAGAGSGALAASILAAAPTCSPALRYVLVERSAVWRERQARRLSLEPANAVLGPAPPSDPDDEPGPGRHSAIGTAGAAGGGPMVTSLPDLPAGPFDGVVLANELLDNLPFRLLERIDGGWAEVRVTADLQELLVPADPEAGAEADHLVAEAEVPTGARIPLQYQARNWVRTALGVLRSGRVVVVDYADTTPSLACRPWPDWLRTYRGHGRGGQPLSDLGQQDVTCEVAVDQLSSVHWPACNDSQADFLADHGIGELVDEARRQWQERASVGDLSAMVARSRVSEAAALTAPAGLGSFRVVEWRVP
ncbi:MAG: SAM-dependent methyltransferase, partial [Actinobacteria bacterium]|nr:SAM-dependent methyltransferase [Actinomycetota bacterium]